MASNNERYPTSPSPVESETPAPLLTALASLSVSSPTPSSPDTSKQWKLPTMPPMQRIAVPIILPPPPAAGSPPIISVPGQPQSSPPIPIETHTKLEEEHQPRHGHRHHKHKHSIENSVSIPVTVRSPNDQEQVQVVVEATPDTTVSDFVREAQRLLSKSSLSWTPEISLFAPDASVTSTTGNISLESPIFELLRGNEFALEVCTRDEYSRQSNYRPTTFSVTPDLMAQISAAAAQCLAMASNESASGSAGCPYSSSSSSSSRSSSPSLSPPWGNSHTSPPSSPEGFGRKRSRAPCMFDYSLIDVPEGSRRIVLNTSCHRCKTRKPQCMVCPLNEKHKFCVVCLERHHNMVVIPPSGCPLCTQSCTCAMCRKKY